MKAVKSVDRLMPSPDDPAHIVKGRERLARATKWLGHLWALNRGGVRRRMKIDEFITTQTNFIIHALHTPPTPTTPPNLTQQHPTPA
jgi:hypothetical protein